MSSTRTAAICCVTLGLVVMYATRLLAHHYFAMFDTGQQVSLTGVVTAFEWTNPHAYIELDVPAAVDGEAAA